MTDHYTSFVQEFLAKHHNTQICQLPYTPDLAHRYFWLFPKLNSPCEVRRYMNAKDTEYTNSINGVSLPND